MNSPTNRIKGYKVFTPEFRAKQDNFQYAENTTFEVKLPIEICRSGLHFCIKASHCFSYYDFDPKNIVCEVEALGETQTHDEDSKVCTNILKVGRILSWAEVLVSANEGKDNTGHSNSGDSNSGNWNSGNWNSGNRNSGDRNSGNRNSGNSNSGYSNSGNSNSGNRNSGDRNSGDSNSGNSNSGYSNSGDSNSGNWNSGNWNSGNRNSGDRNSGDRNSGNRNSGNSNSGYSNSGNSNSGNSNSGNSNSGYSNSGNSNSGNSNSGNRNSGDSNSGNRNSGDSNSGNSNSGNSNSGNWNSGNWNSGNRNSGDSNSGYRNSGAFCNDLNPTLILFDKPTKILVKDWENSEPVSIMNRLLENTIWVYSSMMTKEEKESYPKHDTTDGYLKTNTMKEAWKDMWGNLGVKEKKLFTDLPNFTWEKFTDITGIEHE